MGPEICERMQLERRALERISFLLASWVSLSGLNPMCPAEFKRGDGENYQVSIIRITFSFCAQGAGAFGKRKRVRLSLGSLLGKEELETHGPQGTDDCTIGVNRVTSSTTRRCCQTSSCGYIGSETTSEATCSETGKAPC